MQNIKIMLKKKKVYLSEESIALNLLFHNF